MTRPPTRRGLTLVEVVVAAALLAAIVTATVPILTASPATAPSVTDVRELSSFVDGAFTAWSTPASVPPTLFWEEEAVEVQVTVLPPADDEPLGVWVTFAHGGVSVARWLPQLEGE